MSRVIVLTGATRGLGRSLVPHFVKAGHTVVGCGRNAVHVAALKALFPAPHRFDALDVTDASAVAAWGKSVLDSTGVPDLLINNAAVINTPAPLWKVPDSEIAQLLAVNIQAVASVIRAFVPAMVAQGRGVIVNLSSGWGRSVAADVAPYCATKYAMEGLTLSLALDLPAGLAAIPLNPGIINTDMLRQCFGSGASQFGSAEEWATRAAPFLLKLSTKDNGKSLSVP